MGMPPGYVFAPHPSRRAFGPPQDEAFCFCKLRLHPEEPCNGAAKDGRNATNSKVI
jgi:hypothetical protein